MQQPPLIQPGWFDWQKTITRENDTLKVIIKWNAKTQIVLNDAIIYSGYTYFGLKTVAPTTNSPIKIIRLWWFPILMLSIVTHDARVMHKYWKDSFIWAAKCALLGSIIGAFIVGGIGSVKVFNAFEPVAEIPLTPIK
jgi:hypothetical protein